MGKTDAQHGGNPNVLESFQAQVRGFCEERDWGQFHTPKNLAMALSVEAAEVLEHFQWLTGEESQQLDTEKHGAVAEELGDVLIYLVRLADVLGVDLLEAASAKLESNRAKYPVEKARGSARKYTEL